MTFYIYLTYNCFLFQYYISILKQAIFLSNQYLLCLATTYEINVLKKTICCFFFKSSSAYSRHSVSIWLWCVLSTTNNDVCRTISHLRKSASCHHRLTSRLLILLHFLSLTMSRRLDCCLGLNILYYFEVVTFLRVSLLRTRAINSCRS